MQISRRSFLGSAIALAVTPVVVRFSALETLQSIAAPVAEALPPGKAMLGGSEVALRNAFYQHGPNYVVDVRQLNYAQQFIGTGYIEEGGTDEDGEIQREGPEGDTGD